MSLVEQYRLGRRVHERGGEKEVQFHFRAADRLLPVWQGGQMRIVRWGCRRNDSQVLPCTGWTRLVSLESGLWANWNAEEVTVPAALALDNGVWFKVRQGIRGVFVEDEQGRPCVYLVCEPASHYYLVMTKSPWMPALIGERI